MAPGKYFDGSTALKKLLARLRRQQQATRKAEKRLDASLLFMKPAAKQRAKVAARQGVQLRMKEKRAELEDMLSRHEHVASVAQAVKLADAKKAGYKRA
jgi:hypothetical protein